jgi:manganese/zinc/iron transport system substrate-binding protein
MSFKRTVLGLLLLASLSSLLLLFPGCSRQNNGNKRVLATVGMIGDLARRVGGDTVEVHDLMGAGVDPHLYEPKESDRSRLRQADLILYNGLHLEGKMVETLEKNTKAKAVTAGIPKDRLLEDEGQHDPHVWFDVSLWVYALDAVEKHLTELQPKHGELYKKNAAAYRTELQALHEEVKRDIATVPEKQRVLITAHDAFRYFGKAYGIEVKGLQGVSTANDANLKDVEEIVELVLSRKIKALFPESSVPPDGVKKVMERCRARGHEVKLAEKPLYSDAMDEPGTPGGTYPGMVRSNVRLIVDSLK